MKKVQGGKKKRYMQKLIEVFQAGYCPSCFNKPMNGSHPCCDRRNGVTKLEFLNSLYGKEIK